MDLFIFLPKKLEKSHQFAFNFPFEEFTLARPDNAIINGIWAKAKESKGLVLYFHGNADNLIRWGKIAENFIQMNWDVMIIDYRGYGKSEGKKTEESMFADALASYNFAASHFPKEKIVLYGRSIGSAFATYTAAQIQAPLLILETPFFSMPALFRSYYPFLPRWFTFKFNFRSDRYITQVKAPIWIFHGTWDTVVPYSHALKFKKLLQEKVTLITLETAGHKDCPSFVAYQEGLKTALQSVKEDNIIS